MTTLGLRYSGLSVLVSAMATPTDESNFASTAAISPARERSASYDLPSTLRPAARAVGLVRERGGRSEPTAGAADHAAPTGDDRSYGRPVRAPYGNSCVCASTGSDRRSTMMDGFPGPRSEFALRRGTYAKVSGSARFAPGQITSAASPRGGIPPGGCCRMTDRSWEGQTCGV